MTITPVESLALRTLQQNSRNREISFERAVASSSVDKVSISKEARQQTDGVEGRKSGQQPLPKEYSFKKV
ncbi:MAG: hypothetical protein Q9M13_03060 [Mariprofundales bacterium]|nr:hypothetical protein [Mariprofundales bacterium]